MVYMRKYDINFLLHAILLGGLAWLIQSMWFLNGDVGSLLYDTKLFLSGGTYVQDFLETNPPMIFLIYAPVALLNSLTSWSTMLSVRVYIIMVAFIACWMSAHILKKIIQTEDALLYFILLYVTLFIFLFLPISEFGQREHFFLMLFLPYILAAVLAVEGKKLFPLLACFIGVIAGMGVGMKPYFLAPLILIESYLIVHHRRFLGWVRIESITLSIVLVGYLAVVFWFYPTYIHIMLPLISHLYYVSIIQPWSVFLSRLPVVFSIVVMLSGCFIFFKKSKYLSLIRVLHLALIGMVIAFLIPRAAWYYHIFPAIGLATLFLTIALYQFFTNHFSETELNRQMLVIFMGVTLAIPFYFFLVGTCYSYHIKRDSDLNPLISFINHTFPAAPTIFCFSSNTTGDCFTLVYFTQSQYAGRYPFFWWMKGLQKLEHQYATLPPYIQKDKNFLIETLANDLESYQPELLIINTFDAKMTHGESFQFGQYFSQNKKFNQAWQHYRYFVTIGVFDLYRRMNVKVERI